MTYFILSKKDRLETKIIGLYKSLTKAEEFVKDYIYGFNIINPENKIYIRSEFDFPQRKITDNYNEENEHEVIYCKIIWYRTKEGDSQVILKIEEFQVE